jgi:GNAT superfamily N-acetyltransferase
LLSIDPAQPQDAPAIAAILGDVQLHYGDGGAEPAVVDAAFVAEMLFGPEPAARMLLAKEDGALLGFAAYSFHWPSMRGTRSMFLKELFVRKEQRGRGIGRMFMDALRDTAVATGCSRLEWTTDTDNPDAQRFYEGMGFPAYPKKIFYRVAI